jgi:hypothetical protein
VWLGGVGSVVLAACAFASLALLRWASRRIVNATDASNIDYQETTISIDHPYSSDAMRKE